jgi:hypothetical protein
VYLTNISFKQEVALQSVRSSCYYQFLKVSRNSYIFVSDFSAVTVLRFWVVGFTIAIVASIETVYEKQIRWTAKQLLDTSNGTEAQGIGSMISLYF